MWVGMGLDGWSTHRTVDNVGDLVPLKHISRACHAFVPYVNLALTLASAAHSNRARVQGGGAGGGGGRGDSACESH